MSTMFASAVRATPAELAADVTYFSGELLTERYLRGAVAFDSMPEQDTIFRVRYPLQVSCA